MFCNNIFLSVVESSDEPQKELMEPQLQYFTIVYGRHDTIYRIGTIFFRYIDRYIGNIVPIRYIGRYRVSQGLAFSISVFIEKFDIEYRKMAFAAAHSLLSRIYLVFTIFTIVCGKCHHFPMFDNYRYIGKILPIYHDRAARG